MSYHIECKACETGRRGFGVVEGRSFTGHYRCDHCDSFGRVKVDHFTLAYIEAALWSSNDDAGEPLDDANSLDDIASDTLAKMRADCKAFQDAHGDLFVLANCKSASTGSASEQAGHDFWLTRCGHGAGFWDGDWAEPAASVLDKAARAFGNVDLYVGDDGLVYAYPTMPTYRQAPC